MLYLLFYWPLAYPTSSSIVLAAVNMLLNIAFSLEIARHPAQTPDNVVNQPHFHVAIDSGS